MLSNAAFPRCTQSAGMEPTPELTNDLQVCGCRVSMALVSGVRAMGTASTAPTQPRAGTHRTFAIGNENKGGTIRSEIFFFSLPTVSGVQNRHLHVSVLRQDGIRGHRNRCCGSDQAPCRRVGVCSAAGRGAAARDSTAITQLRMGARGTARPGIHLKFALVCSVGVRLFLGERA